LKIACEAVQVMAGEAELIRGVSLSCAAGELVLLQGPSGSGKSTLLSVMAGLRRPTAGQVTVDGMPVSRFTAHHRDLYRRRVGFLPQRLHLFEDLSALENALVPTLPRGGDPEVLLKARELLVRLELAPVGDRPVRTLSGGEQQRAALVRALAGGFEVLLLDEPTAHQDEPRVALIAALLEAERARGAAVVVAGHDPRLATRLGLARRYSLSAGCISLEAK